MTTRRRSAAALLALLLLPGCLTAGAVRMLTHCNLERLQVHARSLAGPVAAAAPAGADHTPGPARVVVAGSLQSELGCGGDWDPACAATQLTREAADGVWQATYVVPAGSWEYKAALNDGWDENYGALATPNGANIPLDVAAPTAVKFYYDHATHWVTSDEQGPIVTAPGSFQSELGCSADWVPACMRPWLQDKDGDGVYTWATVLIPPGTYEFKVAHGLSWDENYGAGGAPGGANISVTVPSAGAKTTFVYDSATHATTVTSAAP